LFAEFKGKGKGNGKPNRKGDAKGGKPNFANDSAGKGAAAAGHATWNTKLKQKDGTVKSICASFNLREGCNRQNCKFLHVCPVMRPDGSPCGGKHKAHEHKATPH
jgi:hypothetical protein